MIMATFPQSTKISLGQRLNIHARQHWPQLEAVNTRFRGQFAYIDAQLPGGEVIALCRLRYAGSASRWGFAIYRASHDEVDPLVVEFGGGLLVGSYGQAVTARVDGVSGVAACWRAVASAGSCR